MGQVSEVVKSSVLIELTTIFVTPMATADLPFMVSWLRLVTQKMCLSVEPVAMARRMSRVIGRSRAGEGFMTSRLTWMAASWVDGWRRWRTCEPMS